MPNLLLLIPTTFWYKNQYLVSMLEARCGSRLRESFSCGGHPGRHCDWRAPSAMWEVKLPRRNTKARRNSGPWYYRRERVSRGSREILSLGASIIARL